MEVLFYYNTSDDRCINKNITGETSFVGELRDEVDMVNPVIRFDRQEVLRFNYAYIPEFQRYYSVSDRNCFRDGLWDISLAIDVLMSFRGDIWQLYAVVDKQTDDDKGDEYIDDNSLVTDNIMFTTVYDFPSGFNEGPEFILITAG